MNVKDLFDLSGKTAVVTGGFTGLGRQIAEGLLEAGADVAVCARRINKWNDSYEILKKKAASQNRKLIGSKCDVSIQKSVDDFFEHVFQEFNSVDVLVNAAGVAWAAAPQDMKLEDWEKVIQVNLTGTFLCSQSVGRKMINSGSGSIINLSSVVGLYGSDPEILDSIGYSSSKAGVIGFTKDLAMKWAKHNIRINALVPGWFRTHLTKDLLDKREETILRTIPMRRLGSEIELKGAAVFLSSSASSYITGQILCVDGGVTSGR